ncbi:MAG: 30S ribosomal protein S6 [Synergistaceae bacterium]|nr:30S ribosomal protein S6 [Synergistaceae bacterium]MBQ3586094.1 30S ribosomal protein S6 [Synergistaceae bacterium]MBR0167509.1 30S ribosomal protein S6 [Synergistaceae bacterium]MBR0279842.1 30S ribosomal protein S6 [Synergistaceae bacterium]
MLAILDAATENQSEEITKIEEVIKNLGGTVSKSDAWGKRTLAYPIRKKTEGFYVLFSFELEPAQTFELRRILGLRANVYRQLMTVVDE